MQTGNRKNLKKSKLHKYIIIHNNNSYVKLETIPFIVGEGELSSRLVSFSDASEGVTFIGKSPELSDNHSIFPEIAEYKYFSSTKFWVQNEEHLLDQQ